MAKKNPYRPAMKTREANPVIENDKKGNPVISCPFCVPTHPLTMISSKSPCGTYLNVIATQVIYNARNNKKMICVRCGKGGGDMVRTQNAMVHVHDCNPGTVIFSDPPRYTRLAKFVYSLKFERLKKLIESRTGEAKVVHEVEENGEKTGNVLGYFFWKGVPNGKNT